MESLIHSYDGDVTFYIKSPGGTEVMLSNRYGSSGDNYINTLFDDSAGTAIGSGSAPLRVHSDRIARLMCLTVLIFTDRGF